MSIRRTTRALCSAGSPRAVAFTASTSPPISYRKAGRPWPALRTLLATIPCASLLIPALAQPFIGCALDCNVLEPIKMRASVSLAALLAMLCEGAACRELPTARAGPAGGIVLENQYLIYAIGGDGRNE